ncbi:GTP-binding protein [uncultured Massilia sp.]|uniref:GTP-binding protein n=1 Tax=uncultured Massilia sp. TaxID=169973 RepID=UPI00258E1B99|nr:GTP-binding protein [uncultured Massilia sp.]
MLKRTPVTVLAGPLGSGKTTLLNGLLKERLFAGTIVVLSERGAVNPAHVPVAHAGAGRLPATGGSSFLRMIVDPPYKNASTSGEMRATREFAEGPRLHAPEVCAWPGSRPGLSQLLGSPMRSTARKQGV